MPWKFATRGLGAGLLGISIWLAADFPFAAPWLLGGLALYLLLLWRLPPVWLILLPAALPLLDLAYWAGRPFFGAYDLLVLTTLGWGLLRARPWRAGLDRGTLLLGLALLSLQGLVTLHGLLPLEAPAPGAWNDPLASTNALRDFKGILAALLLWPLLATARLDGVDVQRWLTAGMLAALTAAVATILWERGLFTGLLDLTSSYRISGGFSTMLTGGAAIDAALALSAPFVAGLWLLWHDRRLRLLGLALGLAALYAFYVTYSRANYPALTVMALVFAGGIWLGRHHREGPRRARPVAAALLVGGGLLVLLALSGQYIQERFETSLRDLDQRFDHWAGVIALLEDRPAGLWLGAGGGRYPHDHYWRQQVEGEHLALAQRYDQDGRHFIRFSKSDKAGNLFLRQRFRPGRRGKHHLTLSLRAPGGGAATVLVEFCERHILKYRAECRWRKLKVPAGTTDWKDFSVPVNLNGLGQRRFGPFSRPLDVSLMNRGLKAELDIGSAQLFGPGRQPLLANADFADGWSHWFLSYGNHLRWHIKNVFVYWLHQGGILGLAAMLLVCALVAARLARAAASGDGFAVLVASALAGALMVGLFDSLFDEPRIALLFWLLAGAGLITRPVVRHTGETRERRRLRLPARTLRRVGSGLGLTLAVLLLGYLVAPHWFNPLKVRASVWTAQNTPSLDRWLNAGREAQVDDELRALLPPWRPLPASRELAEGEIRIGQRRFKSLRAAGAALRAGQHLEIGPGVYRQPLVIRARGARVTGQGHVVIERTQAQGKAAIIARGDDITIRNIECRHIRVPDRNGACVRQAGRNLTLEHVYFHQAEQGLLTGARPGRVTIRDSRFERLGRFGRAHGIYVAGGELVIEDSQFLAARSWGHEIKSRATLTRLERSLVASLGSNDSRLLDLPHGGRLRIRGSILEQGPASSNEGAIGIGLEGRLHPEQDIVLEDNLIILERDGRNELFQLASGLPAPSLRNNRQIGGEDPGGDNAWAAERAAAGLPPYPALPTGPGD